MINKILILFAFIIFLGCDKNALFDAGESTSKEIILPNRLLHIESQSIFDMVLVQDTIDKIIVICGSNLQKFVSVNVVGDTLYLSQNTKDNWSRSYHRITLEYHTSHDFNVNVRAPIHLISDDTLRMNNFIYLDWTILSEIDIKLNVGNCELVNSPGHFGTFKASGYCKSLYIWNRGSCTFITENLHSKSAIIDQQGQSDIFVSASEQLNVSLENTGNIFYSGSTPSINIEKQISTGKLIKQ